MAQAGGVTGSLSPKGRISPSAGLVTVALCGLTTAGRNRLTGIGQWVKRALHTVRTNLAALRYAANAPLEDAGYLHLPEGRRDHAKVTETLYRHDLI